MEDISDGHYTHVKRVYAQYDTLWTADIFNMCLLTYGFDPAYLVLPTELAWQAALKITKIKLDLSTDIDMLLMIKKSIIGRIFYTIYEYAKVSNEYMKDYDKNKKSLCLNCCDINYL